MKNFIILLLLLTYACSSNKTVYWCGDHECVNKKEKNAYFKKNMIVEKKVLNQKNKQDTIDYEKILNQAKISEKERIKNEKELVKQIKLENKRLKKEEKKRIKREKKNKKQKKANIKKRLKNDEKVDLASSKFSDLKKKIINNNKSRPFPNINDIPN